MSEYRKAYKGVNGMSYGLKLPVRFVNLYPD